MTRSLTREAPTAKTEPNQKRSASTSRATTAAEQQSDLGPEVYGTPRRRMGLTVFILVVLVSVGSVVMPDSVLKDAVLTATRPVLMVTGLDQRWGVFAPNPRLETSEVFAHVQMKDGSFVDMGISQAPGISEYWNYRWRKLEEQMWLNNGNVDAQTSFALWAANQQREAGRQPVHVTLVRHTADNLPPGPGPDTGPWRDIPIFSANVGTS